MKQALVYSLKVWLTAIVLATLILLLIGMVIPRTHAHPHGKLSYLYLAASLIFKMSVVSLPCWLLLILSVAYVIKVGVTNSYSKFILSGFNSMIGIFWFYLVFSDVGEHGHSGGIYFTTAYIVLLIAGIWFYKLTLLSNTPNSQPNLTSEL